MKMLQMKLSNILILKMIVWLIQSRTALACHGELLAAGISEEEKEIILHEHNRLRQQVATGRYPGQPGAKNMKEMLWDNDLAERAQKWAENCQFKHDPHRTINRFTMGQNLAIIWSTAPLEEGDGDFPSRIQNWFNEVQKYSFGDAWTPKTGHYSQLVWGDTNLIGCGFSEYKDANKYNKLYVCNYGPGGNVFGYNPYEAGKPSCAAYGLQSSSRYQGLCLAADSDYNENAIETYEYQMAQATPYKSNANGYYRPQNAIVYNNYPKNSFSSSTVFVAGPQKLQQAGAQQELAGRKYGGSTATQNFYYLDGTNTNNNNNNNLNKYKKYRSGSVAEQSKGAFQQPPATATAAATLLEQQQQQQQQYYNVWQESTAAPHQNAWNLYSWRG